ncbi:MAG TPA: amidohydrolase, partial [Thermoplasmata archaeon]|nr:amidohydrolase [Thermoplasmata archaeon]
MARAESASPVVITDALLVTQDPSRRVLLGDVRVETGRFTHVGPGAPREGATVVEGHGFAVVPGFVNAH